MNILITGGSALVGRNIYEQLGSKYHIVAPSHSELDVLDFKAVSGFIQRNGITHVIHCAMQGGSATVEATLRMFLNLTYHIDRFDRFIYFGSGAEYGKQRTLHKVKESEFGNVIPETTYGLAKYALAQLTRSQNKIVNLRLFGVYGKYEPYWCKFISQSIVKNLLNVPIVIKQNVIFDYVYIDDVVRVVDYFLHHPAKYAAYNVTPTTSISLGKIIDIINAIGHKQVPVTYEFKGFNYEYTGSNQRLLKQIPNMYFHSYHDGIEKLFNYYLDHLPEIDRDRLIDSAYIKSLPVVG